MICPCADVPTTKFEWKKIHPCCPINNIKSHRLVNIQPFYPSYEQGDEKPEMFRLLGMEYNRLWQAEHAAFEKKRKLTAKRKFIKPELKKTAAAKKNLKKVDKIKTRADVFPKIDRKGTEAKKLREKQQDLQEQIDKNIKNENADLDCEHSNASYDCQSEASGKPGSRTSKRKYMKSAQGCHDLLTPNRLPANCFETYVEAATAAARANQQIEVAYTHGTDFNCQNSVITSKVYQQVECKCKECAKSNEERANESAKKN